MNFFACSIDATDSHSQVATPADWKNGDDVIIVSAVSDAEAQRKFPDGWKTVKRYLRIVPQPREVVTKN